MRAGGALLVLLLATAAGCLESGAVVCADGRTCPAGTVCSDGNQRCVSQQQIDACAGLDELATCEVPGAGSGECRGGACLYSICGDGRVEGAETCDGDNLGEGTDCVDIGYYDSQPLSCDLTCQLDQSSCTGGRCGDEIVNGPELCDGAPPEVQCAHIGYQVGALPACLARCEPDTSRCHQIGVERLSLPAQDPPQDLIGTGPDDVYAIARQPTARGGPLFHYDGTTWLRVLDLAYSVWPVARDDVYATVQRDDEITLQHFDGGGWTVIDGVSPGPNQRVLATGPNDIYLFGSEGPAVAKHWDGQSWTEIEDLPAADVVDVWPAGDGTIYLVLSDPPANRLYRLDGVSWQLVDHGLSIVSAVWGTGPDEVWIGGGRDMALWEGSEWTVVADPFGDPGEIRSLSGTASDDMIILVTEIVPLGGGSVELGHLVHFDGKVWTPFADLPGVHDTWAANREAVFLGGNAGTTFRYHGSLWRPEIRLELIVGHQPVGFAFRGGDLYAAINFSAFSDVGLVFRFDGNLWQPPIQVSPELLYDLFTSGTALYAVGQQGLFRRDADDNWIQVDVAGGAEPALHGGWSDGPDARFVVGSNLFHDLGDGWVETDRAAPCPGGMQAVWGSNPSDVFAVGGCGLIMHFDGEKWSKMESGTDAGLTAMWGRAGDDVYAVGADGAALHYDGASWSTMPPLPIAVDLRSISGSAGELFATGGQGLIFHFDGQSWSSLEPDAVIDSMHALSGSDHEVTFMSSFGTEVSFLRLLRTTEWRAP